MSEQKSSVTFRVPDFIDSDGIEYTDIEVTIEVDSDGGVREVLRLTDVLDLSGIMRRREYSGADNKDRRSESAPKS